jgi:hypothetical protein
VPALPSKVGSLKRSLLGSMAQCLKTVGVERVGMGFETGVVTSRVAVVGGEVELQPASVRDKRPALV